MLFLPPPSPLTGLREGKNPGFVTPQRRGQGRSGRLCQNLGSSATPRKICAFSFWRGSKWGCFTQKRGKLCPLDVFSMGSVLYNPNWLDTTQDNAASAFYNLFSRIFSVVFYLYQTSALAPEIFWRKPGTKPGENPKSGSFLAGAGATIVISCVSQLSPLHVSQLSPLCHSGQERGDNEI